MGTIRKKRFKSNLETMLIRYRQLQEFVAQFIGKVVNTLKQ